MARYDGIAQAADAARIYFIVNREALPAVVAAKVEPHTGTGSSPPMLLQNFAEAIYANRDDVPAEAREIAAGCADYCVQQYNLFDPRERGQKIVQVLDGEDVADAPPPLPGYAPTAEAAPPTPPVE